MPTVYSSVFQNFIRQGFAKSFTSGYAQSVVAATHPHVLNSQNRPSFARRNSSRVGRIQSIGLTSAFHTSSNHASSIPAIEHRHEKAGNLGGLEAYFEHIRTKQEAEEGDKEWVQFQFPKRIEWKPSPASILLGGESRAQGPDAVEAAKDETSVPRILSADEAALAHIDAAIEEAIEARKVSEDIDDVVGPRLLTPAPSPADGVLGTRSATPVSNVRSPAPRDNSIDQQSQTYADHLTKLSEAARYAEIPAVFEAMLVAGIRPVATAYNALLVSAIHLPSVKTEIVSRALDVYADMMRRKVSPDSDTYNILVGLLASRSLEVFVSKKTLDDKRVRFGGMDEPGKFMFASHELEHAILVEDDRLDLALRLFELSALSGKAAYSPETYHQLISACAQAGRVADMLQLFEHMESTCVTPFAATFPAMITAFAQSGDLISAVECYNEYRSLAIGNDNGNPTLNDRLDAQVYAAVINAYVISDKIEGAMLFYKKIVEEYGVRASDIKDAIVKSGFVKGFLDRGIFHEALQWAQAIDSTARTDTMSEIAAVAADNGETHTALAAFANVPASNDATIPAIALLAMHIRGGDIASASRYWQILSNPETRLSAALIEPTAMYAVAMIGSGQVAEGLSQSEFMLQRIRESTLESSGQVADQIEEASEFISRFMTARNISDPREVASQTSYAVQTASVTSFPSTPTVSSYEDTFDPYARNTDFKGSSIIADELEGTHGRKGPKLNDALTRFRNMRRAGRHPRYVTYAKLISAAARDGKMDLCRDILAMARTDVPLLPQYAVVRYGWSSILDAMVGACLTQGDRAQAERYHQELLEMGAAPSANTFGLYITTLKESTKTFDEASEAVKIFHRAKAEGVEPSSFLYNALIGKLGKARRIDDCLFFFAEMRALGIKPTSVTYGTIVNALCRVSDEKFAEELFDEMEAMPNYKARPAPYNSMMQFFLTSKRDKSKVLAYFERMKSRNIAPTTHTYKLLIDTYATLEPVDMSAAEAVLKNLRTSGGRPEPVHFASLIHARGCVLHDMEGARSVFDTAMADPTIPANACLFQALFEAMVANHKVRDAEPVLETMRAKRIDMTPYIANTLIHGWAAEGDIAKAMAVYSSVSRDKREPSTYEAMTRAYLAVEDRIGAGTVVREMVTRGYPGAVVNKVLELLGGGSDEEVAASTA